MNNQIPINAYAPRRTSPTGVIEIGGWTIKCYAISASGDNLDNRLMKAAVKYVTDELPWPDIPEPHYGFLTVHVGEESVWLLVDLWAVDIMRHFLYSAHLDNAGSFSNGPDDGSCACVWELEVIRHERDAWVRHVLSKPADPDFESYLLDCLHVD